MNKENKNTEITPDAVNVTEAAEVVETPVQEPAQETFQERVPSKKRTALLRYMTVMFAAAFLLVLMSFLLQMKEHDVTITEMSQTSASALSKAESLQERNRQLQEEKDELQEDLSTAREYVELAREEGEANVENTVAAYDALVKVLTTGVPEDGDVEYSKAVETVKNLQEYLSDEAVAVFEEVMNPTEEDPEAEDGAADENTEEKTGEEDKT